MSSFSELNGQDSDGRGEALPTERVLHIKADQELQASPDLDVARSGDTVTIACKLPHGIMLQIYRMVDSAEPMIGGGTRMVQKAQPIGASIRLNGFAHRVGVAPRSLTYGRYGMTYNVPKDFWDEWCRQNYDSPLLEQNLIFAHARYDYAQAQAVEQKTVMSGMEPIDPTAKTKVGSVSVETMET